MALPNSSGQADLAAEKLRSLAPAPRRNKCANPESLANSTKSKPKRSEIQGGVRAEITELPPAYRLSYKAKTKA
jgi:hypothetical protein